MLVRFVLWMFSAGLMLLAAGGACGQSYPIKPIRIVTPGSGGAADFAARLIAPGLTAGLGQQVIVDNRSSTIIPGEIVSKAPPDGYTLLIFGAPFWIGPLLEKTPYDPVRDFQPITAAVRQPNILVVHPSLPVKSVNELIALAKARPGVLNYASVATGSSSHLSGELFKAMAGVSLVRVPYKGSGAAMVALVSGEVEISFASAGTVAGAVRSGRLRALAVTTAQPSPLVPGLPTVAIGSAVKLATDELKAFYYEAVVAQPGKHSSASIDAWFWNQTAAGKLFLALHSMARKSDEASLKALAVVGLVPRAVAHALGEGDSG